MGGGENEGGENEGGEKEGRRREKEGGKEGVRMEGGGEEEGKSDRKVVSDYLMFSGKREDILPLYMLSSSSVALTYIVSDSCTLH